MLKANPPPVCALNPQVVEFPFSHLLLSAPAPDKVTTSKSKQRRGVTHTHTHTHTDTCIQAAHITRPERSRFSTFPPLPSSGALSPFVMYN